AVLDMLLRRLAEQSPAEHQARGYLALFQVTDYLLTLQRGSRPDREGKTEPARLRANCCLGQDKEFFQVLQLFPQEAEIAAAGVDESRQLAKLGYAYSGLHIGKLQVIADVRISVFV